MNAAAPPAAAGRRRIRRILFWVLIGTAIGFTVLLVIAAAVVPLTSDALRGRLVAALADRLNGDVALETLHVRVLPRFHAEGTGLAINFEHRHDGPPLLNVKAFTVDADLLGLIRKHVAEVRIDGFDISVPPDRAPKDHESDVPEATAGQRIEQNGPAVGDFVIDRLVSTKTRLIMIPKSPDDDTKVWDIHTLTMRTVGVGRAMPFDATLTNAVPPGEIGTAGIFGPWQRDNPGGTPLEGTFTFNRADLSVFKGISGILAAHGEFGGALGRIQIHGETDTPDFTVSVSGQPVHLHADYHTTVDGTNGNTYLDRIDARFLNTSLVAKGAVAKTPGEHGRTVTLDIAMDDARLEDVLRLAVKSPSAPMTGALVMKTKFILPPGHEDVVEKLQLDGQFSIATAKFTDLDVQKKVDELSNRSRGKLGEDETQRGVVSNFTGRFTLGNGALSLPGFSFNTPGAKVQLHGGYRLKPETLNFTGKLLMDAKISETQKGWKHWVLKAVDPLFSRKGGGSEIPIKIEGQRSDPKFGLDKGRIFHRGS